MLPSARRNALRALLLFSGLSIVGCGPTGDDDTGTPEPDCTNDEAPTLLVQPVEDGQPAGFPVEVLAQATDPDGINTVTLYYRHIGDPTFQFVFMDLVGSEAPDVFAAAIPGEFVLSPGAEFYLRVTDQLVPCTEQLFWPEQGPDGPESFTILEEVRPLPFSEGWEFTSPPEQTSVDDLGWTLAMLSLPQNIHAFRLDGRNPLSGDWAVSHGEGIPGGFWECPTQAGIGIDRDNWLVSPPLDLRTKEEIAVRWYERAVDGWFCDEVHELWISTTSPDPAVGGYELVTTLSLPTEAWQSSPWVDISAWAGVEKAYLALRYHGGAAGRWVLDDLYVGEPLATLEAEDVATEGTELVPGATDVALNVRLRNVSTQYTAPNLHATLSTADDGVVITQELTTYPSMAPDEVASIDGPVLTFNVQTLHPDNTWLDFTLLLEDDADHAWSVPVRLLMGGPSSLRVDYTLGVGASLQLETGHGPISAPDWSVGTTSAALVGGSWIRDVTDQGASLPPGPGPRRWFFRATNTGTTEATLDAATVTVDGVGFDVADLPTTVSPGDQITRFLPPKPLLSVVAFTVSPDPVGPGDHVTMSDLAITNTSSGTAGQLNCVLDSPEADATGFSNTPIQVGVGPLGQGDTGLAQDAFGFDVSISHTDASPLDMAVICTDGADSFALTFELQVPYAHPTTSGYSIDDDDGNEDGYADAGEVIDLYLTATNDGAFETTGPVTATIAMGVGSTAAFVLSATGTLTFGAVALAPGDDATTPDPVQVAIDGTAHLGDRIVLDVTYADDTDLWTESLTLEVTGLPWTPCPEADDPQGDVAGVGTFDIKNCSFRSDGELLQLRLDAWEPFANPALSLWAFFYEVPTQYTLEYAPPGAPDLEEGCVAWDIDVPPSVPITVETGDDWISIRLATGDMNILGDNVQVAFGTEYCAGQWWCDVFPDNSVYFNAGQVGCFDQQWFPIYW